jgi:hypothetical protein
MNEIVLANLLFQGGAATALLLVAGISATRQLHSRRPTRRFGIALPDSRTVVDLPAVRATRSAQGMDIEAHSKAA